jgi:hypothetical protein
MSEAEKAAANVADNQADPNDWSQKWGPSITLVVFVLAISGGIYGILHPNPILVGLLLGIAGGIAHEIVQSGGKVLIPKRVAGGDLNLGTLSGAVLGIVSGFLVLHGVDLTKLAGNDMLNIAFEALTAGLALKGVADVDSRQSPAPPHA